MDRFGVVRRPGAQTGGRVGWGPFWGCRPRRPGRPCPGARRLTWWPALRPGRVLDGLGTGLFVARDLRTVLALSAAFALKGRLTLGSVLLVQR